MSSCRWTFGTVFIAALTDQFNVTLQKTSGNKVLMVNLYALFGSEGVCMCLVLIFRVINNFHALYNAQEKFGNHIITGIYWNYKMLSIWL